MRTKPLSRRAKRVAFTMAGERALRASRDRVTLPKFQGARSLDAELRAFLFPRGVPLSELQDFARSEVIMGFEPEGRLRDLEEPERLRDLRAADRPTFQMIVRAEPGVDDTRALRALLKSMLRRFGIRCLSIKPVKTESD